MMLSSLSESNPHLQKLALQLNYPMNYLGARDLAPAPTEPLLSNTFPYLTDFSLKGLLEPPRPDILSTFLSSHPHLRSLTCYISTRGLTLPDGLFPELECFEGDALLLAAICDTLKTPHNKLARVKIRESHGTEAVTTQMVQFLPKLTKLVDLYVGFGYSEKVTPQFMRILGESCLELKTLSLRDPVWFGERVSIAAQIDLTSRRLPRDIHRLRLPQLFRVSNPSNNSAQAISLECTGKLPQGNLILHHLSISFQISWLVLHFDLPPCRSETNLMDA